MALMFPVFGNDRPVMAVLYNGQQLLLQILILRQIACNVLEITLLHEQFQGHVISSMVLCPSFTVKVFILTNSKI